MDALSSLASIAASNALAGIGAPAPIDGTPGPDPTLPVSPPASVSVFLSDFAQSLLAQQASDPTLSIDTAFARSVLGLTQNSNDGQLFTSSGLLQPFSSALLAQPATTTDTTGSQIPDPNTVGIAAQATLTSEESLTNIQNDTSTAVTVTPPLSAPAVTASSLANTQTPTVTTDTTQPATTTDTTAIDQAAAGATTAATTAVATTDNGIVIPAETASVTTEDQPASDNLDPFQQATLISGLTSFGREQTNFIPAASGSIESVIQGIAAIMPVGARNNDSTEAWINARR